MTTVKDLKTLVSGGESGNLEFKIKVNHPEKIVREIVAFANAKGGTLLIGVDDDKTIIGVKDPIEEMEALNKAINEMVRPHVQYTTGLIPITRKRQVVYYHIKESKNKPHFVNPSARSKNGTAYFRFEDRSIQASTELLTVIRRNKRHKKGYMLHYGPVEEVVVKNVHDAGASTLNEIQQSTGVQKNQISKALVNLVLANVLEIEPRDGEDLFLTKQNK